MDAKIGMRNFATDFGDLVDTVKSANSLLGNDNTSDKAKTYMVDLTINGERLV
jgi:hypothetical protein